MSESRGHVCDKPVGVFRIAKDRESLCKSFGFGNTAHVFSKKLGTGACRVKAGSFEHIKFLTVKTVFIAGLMVSAQQGYEVNCIFGVLDAPVRPGKEL